MRVVTLLKGFVSDTVYSPESLRVGLKITSLWSSTEKWESGRISLPLKNHICCWTTFWMTLHCRVNRSIPSMTTLGCVLRVTFWMISVKERVMRWWKRGMKHLSYHSCCIKVKPHCCFKMVDVRIKREKNGNLSGYLRFKDFRRMYRPRAGRKCTELS